MGRIRPLDLRPFVLFLSLAGVLSAQAPSIGVIDFYGVRKSSEEKLRKVIGIHEGDLLTSSKGSVEDKLEAQPNIVQARLQAVCCDAGKVILYVGVEEK